MLTIFAVPKLFEGHFGIIQRNAITSWTLLRPKPEIILFGNEKGTAEICRELKLRHEPEVAQNEFLTPLLNDLFEKATEHATSEILCFVNADIILMNDFSQATECFSKWRRRSLMFGRRWDVDIEEPLDFGNPHYEVELRSRVQRTGKLRHAMAIDYFVFRKGLFASIPPFAVGRIGYDNWLLWYAGTRRAALIDATQVVTAIHQDHDYSHVRQLKGMKVIDEKSVSAGEESNRNRELMKGHHYGIKHATHRLTSSGIKRNIGLKYLRRRTKPFRQRIKAFIRSLMH